MALTRKAAIRSKQLATTLTVGEEMFIRLLEAYVVSRTPAQSVPDLIAFTLAAREAMLNVLEP